MVRAGPMRYRRWLATGASGHDAGTMDRSDPTATSENDDDGDGDNGTGTNGNSPIV